MWPLLFWKFKVAGGRKTAHASVFNDLGMTYPGLIGIAVWALSPETSSMGSRVWTPDHGPGQAKNLCDQAHMIHGRTHVIVRDS